ncbi:MAG: glutamine-hydrolyzing GMP synthase [Bdellovibrionaceae bacterium]|nr:glutamine-hydrolyzing GMP synthase [Bdellovibrionales bacterium]MCB9083652.1 glutamine-hydrolyzing GMP synthase [Pseudobdellovibrionaceae bacterium]
MEGGFLVLDFGSQYTQIIARRLRELGVYSELLPYDMALAEIKARKPKGIILSGGPSSVNEAGAPHRDVHELAAIAPLLGICYGMQLISAQMGGVVESADRREYGLNVIKWSKQIGQVPKEQNVWMSHGDVVKKVPPGFEVVATSAFEYPAALMSDRAWAFQFHPEVSHTDHGMDLLKAFVFNLCQAEPDWAAPSITEHLLEEVRKQVPDGEHVLCALSGGVDSTVVGTLLTKALGADRVHCVFVDTGLLRKNEFQQVLETYKELGLNVKGVDASQTFMSKLKGVADPEKKRKIIGHTFIEVFKDSIKEIGPIDWLAQGTLYPDVIESISLRGTSVTIKSHHNVGGLPKDLDLKLIEPLRELFKDEVRAIGKELGIPHGSLWRHPFPGPGLAIRILDEITPMNVSILQEVDAIYIDELKAKGLYDKIWQAFCVLLPVKTVGVQGDARTYERVAAIRAVTSSDGMTADWFAFPPEFLRHLSNRITNEVKGVNRVVYDVTSKPPGTIEWE